MPKQIKVKHLDPRELKNAKLSIAALGGAFLFGGTFTALLSVLGKESADGSPLAVAVSCSFVIYLILLLIHCIHGFVTFEKLDHYGVLMTSVLTAFSAFTAILNVQFAAALFFTALGMEDSAKSVIGGKGFDEFMQTQRTSGILMSCGVAGAIIAGLIGIVKLGKNAGKR